MDVLDALDEARVTAHLQAGTPFWLRLTAPDAVVLERAGALLEIPPFAVEDSVELGQRPKLDAYGATALWVAYGVRDRDPVEVHLHIGRTWLVTVCADPGYALLPPGREAPGSLVRLVYEVLDGLGDSYGPCTDEIEQEVEQLETALLRRPTPAERRRLLDRRNEIVVLRQHAVPQRDITGSPDVVLEHLPVTAPDGRKGWVRDLHDALAQVVTRLDAEAQSLDNALQLHLALVAARQNDVVERLTVLTTIFLPLTALTGFFGMNFGWLVDHIDTWQAFVGYALVGGAASVVVLRLYVARLRGGD